MTVKCAFCLFENPDSSYFCAQCGYQLVSDEELSSSKAIKSKDSPKKSIKLGIIAERYKLSEELGRGGMGVVYKAFDNRLKRFVALKFLPANLSLDLKARERLINEARATAGLDHPNICTVYEIVEEVNNTFISMAYIEGESIREKINKGPFPLDYALNIIIQIAKGLEEAHKKGIVHRDIKSGNIMIAKNGQAKIMDFGLAKVLEETDATRTASVMGTVLYMSPEQASSESVDCRSDIWSLGVVMFEILTAILPFPGENAGAVINSIIHKSPKLPSEIDNNIPPQIERIILKCLRKLPEDRYQSVTELLSDLNKLQSRKSKERKQSEYDIQVDVYKETERRHATVMFLEVSGFEEIHLNIDPEEALSIRQNCFEMISMTIEVFGGQIYKIMGNKIFAVFGIPVAIENAPIEALNAAIEIQSELIRFNKEKKLIPVLDVHIGINSGIVISGPLASDMNEYSITGVTVDVASQILDLTESGKIIVGPRTYKYTRHYFDFKRMKSVKLKGQKDPISLYTFLSKKEQISRGLYDSDRMINSEMVARDKELNKLELHILKVLNNEGSIVSVIGEAGIGKSRLIAEFLHKDAFKKVLCLKGRALSFGKNLSYYPK